MEVLDNLDNGNILPKDEVEIRKLRTDAMDAQDDLRLGRIALLGLIVLSLLGIAFSIYKGHASLLSIFIEGGFMVLVFTGAFFLSEKKPMVAFMVAGVLYLLQIAGVALVMPGSLFKGIVFKLLIIFFLVKGIISSSKFEEIREKLRAYGEDLKIPGIMNKKY
ncbi:MAG: hypothetical protein GC192_03120 [Bacteroidetes bacterium]|nr:hypothetical protein [Bacteroidota bacterium]